jgi:hypothetical protein
VFFKERKKIPKFEQKATQLSQRSDDLSRSRSRKN